MRGRDAVESTARAAHRATTQAEDHAERAWRAMTALVTELNDRKTEVAAELGISFVRIKALRRLARNPMSMSDLAQRLTTDAPYTTVVVDDLEQRGLVKRRPHPDDRRRKIVTVTPAGLRVARTAENILRRPPAALLALSGAELAELDRMLSAVVADHLG